MRHRNRSYQRASVIDRRRYAQRAAMVDLNTLIKDATNRAWKPYYGSLGEIEPNVARAEIERRYRIEYEIGASLFKTDHWQTLFLLEYPMLR